MSNAEALLGKIRRKYKEYGINEKPFVIVKADAGTYGMGIMTVRDPKDLADLNRTHAQQDERHQGRPGGQRGHPAGRRADLRARQRRGGRAGGLHDRPLRGRRLLPRQRRARHRREPQRARARASCRWPSPKPNQLPQARRQARRQRAEPLLHVRRDRAAWRCWRRATSSKRPTRTPRSTSKPAQRRAALLRCNMRRAAARRAAHNSRSSKHRAGRAAQRPVVA